MHTQRLIANLDSGDYVLRDESESKRLARASRLAKDPNKAKNIQQAGASQKAVMESANCLLWYANVSREKKESGDVFHWEIDLPFEDVVRVFFPLDVAPDETYVQAWNRSKFDEDKKQMNVAVIEALSAGWGAYAQTFRCRRKDGTIRWIFENVHIESIDTDQWHLVGICSDITWQKELAEALSLNNIQYHLITQAPE